MMFFRLNVSRYQPKERNSSSMLLSKLLMVGDTDWLDLTGELVLWTSSVVFSVYSLCITSILSPYISTRYPTKYLVLQLLKSLYVISCTLTVTSSSFLYTNSHSM